eukprot:1152861-Pelagomonas_calceolata.AAC.3
MSTVKELFVAAEVLCGELQMCYTMPVDHAAALAPLYKQLVQVQHVSGMWLLGAASDCFRARMLLQSLGGHLASAQKRAYAQKMAQASPCPYAHPDPEYMPRVSALWQGKHSHACAGALIFALPSDPGTVVLQLPAQRLDLQYRVAYIHAQHQGFVICGFGACRSCTMQKSRSAIHASKFELSINHTIGQKWGGPEVRPTSLKRASSHPFSLSPYFFPSESNVTARLKRKGPQVWSTFKQPSSDLKIIYNGRISTLEVYNLTNSNIKVQKNAYKEPPPLPQQQPSLHHAASAGPARLAQSKTNTCSCGHRSGSSGSSSKEEAPPGCRQHEQQQGEGSSEECNNEGEKRGRGEKGARGGAGGSLLCVSGPLAPA